MKVDSTEDEIKYNNADWWDEDGHWMYDGRKWTLGKENNDKCNNTNYQ